MKPITHSLFTIGLLMVLSIQLSGQSKAKIANVDFFQEGNNLAITYDIESYKTNEVFFIWVNILTASGEKVEALKYSGDVGSGVTGGRNKKIIWDMGADNISLNEGISVEVFAKVSKKDIEGKAVLVEEPANEPAQKTENNKADKKPEKVKSENTKTPKTVGKKSAGKAILFSVLLPGLGTTYAKGGGANWLWGVAGYGCIAGGIVMNNAAYKTLDEYAVEPDIDKRNELYDKAKGQNNGSTIFFAGAAVIWVGNIISSAVKAGKINKEYNKSKVQLFLDYDQMSQSQRLGIAYRF